MSATDAALAAVQAGLLALEEAVAAVRTTVVEDRPDDAEHAPDHKALADLADAVDDLADVLAQTGWRLRTAERTPLRCLATVHDGVLDAGRVLREDLLCVDGRFDAARREVRAWGAQWRPWTDVVHAGLVEALGALSAAERSVAAAWPTAAGLQHERLAPTARHEEALS